MPVSNILVPALAYCLMFLLFACAKQCRGDLEKVSAGQGQWGWLYARQLGTLAVIIAASLLMRPGPTFLLQAHAADNYRVLALLVTGTVIIAVVSVQEIPPNDAGPRSSPIHGFVYVLLRTVYLGFYEWFFRGLVLFACIRWLGTVAAILVNVALYALIHVFNRKQFIGSIPFGLVLCLFTLWWQSIWPAILLHWLLASVYESFYLRPFFISTSKHKS